MSVGWAEGEAKARGRAYLDDELRSRVGAVSNLPSLSRPKCAAPAHRGRSSPVSLAQTFLFMLCHLLPFFLLSSFIGNSSLPRILLLQKRCLDIYLSSPIFSPLPHTHTHIGVYIVNYLLYIDRNSHSPTPSPTPAAAILSIDLSIPLVMGPASSALITPDNTQQSCWPDSFPFFCFLFFLFDGGQVRHSFLSGEL